MNNAIEDLKLFIENTEKIVILTHVNPDGDAIGSSLCLYNFLREKKKKVSIIVPNDIPDYLQWMPGAENIIIDKQNEAKSRSVINDADGFVCIDFNEMKRIDQLKELVNSSEKPKVLIDHHPHPSDEFDIYYSKIDISSSSEWVFSLLKSNYGLNALNDDSATCSYTGIITDTGNFSHNTHVSTFVLVADLLTKKIDRDKIFSKVFDNYSADRMRLMGYCLKDKMVYLPEFHAAFISLSKEDQDLYNFKTGDCEGFVNLPLSIKDVVFTAFFNEKDTHVKISLRSKGIFNVTEVAKKYFNGGGHKNASGGELVKSLKEVEELFMSILPEYKDKLNEAILLK